MVRLYGSRHQRVVTSVPGLQQLDSLEQIWVKFEYCFPIFTILDGDFVSYKFIVLS
jgi:hypothetical protein